MKKKLLIVYVFDFTFKVIETTLDFKEYKV